MLFSGLVQSYQCPHCKTIYSTRIPTSVIPLLVLCLISSALWAEALSVFSASKLVIIASAFLLALISIPVFILFVQRITTPWLRKLSCPECAVALDAKGGGFIDGASPDKLELLTYLLLIGFPLIALAVSKALVS